MSLTPEQKTAVAQWIAAGDNLSAVQKKLKESFSLSLTYMDVRFIVDDLDLHIKDPAPKADASDVTKTPPRPAATPERAPAKKTPPAEATDEAELLPDDADGLPPEDLPEEAADAELSSVTVEVDRVTLIPGAVASGSVTFSDGVTGKWIVDQYGRPGFTEVSQPGYRPTPADGQAFMQELSAALQKRGF